MPNLVTSTPPAEVAGNTEPHWVPGNMTRPTDVLWQTFYRLLETAEYHGGEDFSHEQIEECHAVLHEFNGLLHNPITTMIDRRSIYSDAFRDRLAWEVLIGEYRRWADVPTVAEREEIALEQVSILAGWKSWPPQHLDDPDEAAKRRREEWAAALDAMAAAEAA